MALNLKCVKRRDYGSYKTKKVKKEHEKETKADEEATTQVDEEAPVPLVTHVNIILHSIFSYNEMYINNQEIYNSYGLYEQNLTIPSTSRGHFRIKMSFALRVA